MVYGKNNLERLIQENGTNQFKSRGERKIANFLQGQKISYQYEQATLVKDRGDKQRIWYIDFYLPEFGTYIEFFGMVGNPDYDKGIKVKESIYSKMEMDVIAIYPHMFNGNWQDYIMNKIGDKVQRQYNKFLSSPFNTIRDQYIPESKFINEDFY